MRTHYHTPVWPALTDAADTGTTAVPPALRLTKAGSNVTPPAPSLTAIGTIDAEPGQNGGHDSIEPR